MKQPGEVAVPAPCHRMPVCEPAPMCGMDIAHLHAWAPRLFGELSPVLDMVMLLPAM